MSVVHDYVNAVFQRVGFHSSHNLDRFQPLADGFRWHAQRSRHRNGAKGVVSVVSSADVHSELFFFAEKCCFQNQISRLFDNFLAVNVRHSACRLIRSAYLIYSAHRIHAECDGFLAILFCKIQGSFHIYRFHVQIHTADPALRKDFELRGEIILHVFMFRLGNMIPGNVCKGANFKVQIQRSIVFEGL